jgi:hypothetical protein
MRLALHVAWMWRSEIVYRVLLEEMNYLEELGIDGSIIVIWILGLEGVDSIRQAEDTYVRRAVVHV